MDFKNFAISTVATAPSPATSGTSLVVASGAGAKFPTVFPFNAVIWATASNPTSANAEIVTVTNISTDTLTIVRAAEGTTARTVVTGDQIMFAPTADMFRRIEGHYAIVQSDFALSAASGVQAAFPSDRDTFTLKANTLYEVEGCYMLSTGTTTHTTAMAFALTTATVNWFEYDVILWSAAANTLTTTQSTVQVSGVASKVLNATSTAATTIIRFKGLMSVATGGTVVPQINFSANPGGSNTMDAGSYIKFKNLGINSTAVIGDFA